MRKIPSAANFSIFKRYFSPGKALIPYIFHGSISSGSPFHKTRFSQAFFYGFAYLSIHQPEVTGVLRVLSLDRISTLCRYAVAF